MAIVIPSSKTYDRQNPKVRDNVIERIEVGAVEVVPDNEYETPVYNERFLSFDLIESESDPDKKDIGLKDEYKHTAVGSTNDLLVAFVAYCAYQSYKKSSFSLKIPRLLKTKLIDSIMYGVDDNKNPNIKYTVYCAKKSGVATGEFVYGGSYDGFTNCINISLEEGQIDKTKSHSIPEEISYTYTGTNTLTDLSGSATATAKIYKSGSIFSATPVYEENEIKIDFDLVTSATIVKLGANPVVVSSGRFLGSGTYEEYIPNAIEITVYGNTIGIDLTDKTIYINGETAKKVYRIDGNELMQNKSTYKEIELSRPVDYTVTEEGVLVPEYNYAKTLTLNKTYNKNIYIQYRQDGVSKETKILPGKTIASFVYNSSLLIDRVYYINVFVNNSFVDFYKTQQAYKNGKETATIRCSISDYYGYGEGGAKEISIDNSTKKMTFDIGDKVVPMVYGADGKDLPMSLEKLGEPKVFEVLGVEKNYDGAVWQTLHLQEIKSKNYTARIKEGALFNDGNGFSFLVIGSGDIYMKNGNGTFTLVSSISSPIEEVRVDIKRSEYVDWAVLEEASTQYYIATFEFRGSFKKIGYADTKEIAGGSGRYATLIEVLSYNSRLSSTYESQFSYRSINALKNLPKDITTLARRTAYYAGNPTEILEIPRTIKKISEEAFSQSDITRVKFLHNDNDYIELPKAGSGTGMFYNKNAVSMTIYTDNLTIKNYDWATDNITPTFLHIDGTAWE